MGILRLRGFDATDSQSEVSKSAFRSMSSNPFRLFSPVARESSRPRITLWHDKACQNRRETHEDARQRVFFPKPCGRKVRFASSTNPARLYAMSRKPCSRREDLFTSGDRVFRQRVESHSFGSARVFREWHPDLVPAHDSPAMADSQARSPAKHLCRSRSNSSMATALV
jgi:hypothetical protein